MTNQHKIIANIGQLTRNQIDELKDATGITNTSQLVSMAIDRMYREEAPGAKEDKELSAMEIAALARIADMYNVHPRFEDGYMSVFLPEDAKIALEARRIAYHTMPDQDNPNVDYLEVNIKL